MDDVRHSDDNDDDYKSPTSLFLSVHFVTGKSPFINRQKKSIRKKKVFRISNPNPNPNHDSFFPFLDVVR